MSMSIFSRLTDIVQSNLNAILDRAEDPQKMIRMIIQEMEGTLVEVRSSTVRIIADRKELERRIATLNRDAAGWEEKAELALNRGREDLARGALAEKAKVTRRIEAESDQLAEVDEALSKANDDLRRLQEKLDDAKSREAALVARHKTASARVKARSTLYDPRVDDAFARFEQVERNLDELEGKVESYDLGRNAAKVLDEEIAELETEHAVDRDLERLKARMAGRDR